MIKFQSFCYHFVIEFWLFSDDHVTLFNHQDHFRGPRGTSRSIWIRSGSDESERIPNLPGGSFLHTPLNISRMTIWSFPDDRLVIFHHRNHFDDPQDHFQAPEVPPADQNQAIFQWKWTIPDFAMRIIFPRSPDHFWWHLFILWWPSGNFLMKFW